MAAVQGAEKYVGAMPSAALLLPGAFSAGLLMQTYADASAQELLYLPRRGIQSGVPPNRACQTIDTRHSYHVLQADAHLADAGLYGY